MINYVTGFMFSKDRRNVVLISKLNPAWQRGLLNGIGGKIESGETPAQAMSREFKEETGVQTSDTQWTPFAVITHQETYHVNFFFTFDDVAFNVTTTEKEVVGVYDVNALPIHVIANLTWLIPLALDRSLQFDTPALFQEVALPCNRATRVA